MPEDPNSLPNSFNPFATHPFTNGSGVVPRPPLPSTYPAHVPSSHVRTYYAKAMAPEVPALSASMESMSSITTSSSNASSQSTTPLHSPKPSRVVQIAPASTRQIFVPFRKDASTPELVLKKRPPIPMPANGIVRAK